jgi:hypothetical protein
MQGYHTGFGNIPEDDPVAKFGLKNKQVLIFD